MSERIWAAIPADGVMKPETLYGWTTAEHVEEWQNDEGEDPVVMTEYVRADTAAARLAEVEAERDRFQKALEQIAGGNPTCDSPEADAQLSASIARAALTATPAPEAVKPREFGPPYELTHTDGEWWTLKAHGFVVATYSLKSWGSADKIIEAAWQHAYGQPAPMTPEVGALVEAAKRALKYLSATKPMHMGGGVVNKDCRASLTAAIRAVESRHE